MFGHHKTKIAIVGAAGAVGREALGILQSRRYAGNVGLFGSSRSAGKTAPFFGRQLEIRELTVESFRGFHLAIFAAGSGVARDFAPAARHAGCIVIDNSTAFRLEDGIPLVVPEINGHEAMLHRGIIANPNCTTTILLMALYPLHRAFGLQYVFASTYQATSGAGARGPLELEKQSREWLQGSRCAERNVFPRQIAFNVVPQVDAFSPSGYTKEEDKIQAEGRKIMGHPAFRASVTCVRVPVFTAHSIAAYANFERPIDAERALAVLRTTPGIEVWNEADGSAYPTPLDAAGRDDCFVGRVRKDTVLPNGISFWVCGDQLRKGAALNAVQIAELLLR